MANTSCPLANNSAIRVFIKGAPLYPTGKSDGGELNKNGVMPTVVIGPRIAIFMTSFFVRAIKLLYQLLASTG